MSCFVTITHYGRYGKLVEGLNLATIFKGYKKGNIDVDKKNDGVESDGEDVEDNEGDDEDFAIDTESVVDSDANVINPREADKSVEDTVSALPGTVGKKIDDADKGVCGIGKEVGDAVRYNGEV